MIVAIASGKGGTGKTSVSVNLAKVFDGAIQLLDCDVEEPNVHLFLPGTPVGEEEVTIAIPDIDAGMCDACDKCVDFCQFHALASVGKTPLLFPELCHACGGCMLVCPRDAIREKDHRIGVIKTSQAGAITLFDFDDCAYNWFAADLAIVVFYMITNAAAPEALAAGFLPPFLRGYAAENRLHQRWLATLPDFMTMREIDLYAVIHRSYGAAAAEPETLPHDWTRRFMVGRRARIEAGLPYVDFDFTTLGSYLL